MLYHGCGFEMLATLMQHCCPSLLSLYNKVQGKSKSIIEYQSCFDGLTLELAWCKVVIPLFLLVMLFLRALHSWYESIFEQYWSYFKPIEATMLDSLVADVIFHNGLMVVDHKKKPGPAPGS